MSASLARVLLIAACAACGDGLTITDAPAVPSDDLRGLVTVQYLDVDQPVGGLRVFFQDVDSSLVLATRTQRDGTANAFMAPGGFVTVVEADEVRLFTFAGVMPGDHLIVDRRVRHSTDQVTVTVTVPEDPGAVGYQVRTPCGQHNFSDLWPVRGSTATLDFIVSPCDGQVSDMLVMSFDTLDTSGPPRGFLYRPAVPIEVLSNPTFTGPFHPPTTSTISLTNVPEPSQLFTMVQALGTKPGLFTAYGALTRGAGWSATLRLPIPPGATVVTRIDEQAAADRISSFHLIDWGDFAAAHTIDVGGAALHPLVGRPTFEPESHTVRWREGPEGAQPDAVLVELSYTRPGLADIAAWRMIAPHGAETTARFPVLPAPELGPHATDDPNVFGITTLSTAGGFDAIRGNLLGRFQNNVSYPIDGATGHVVLEILN